MMRAQETVIGAGPAVLPYRGQDLRDVSWDGRGFRDISFAGSDLRGANLADCLFIGCDFTDADLVDACLAGAQFYGCVFAYTRFAATMCADTVLADCVFAGVGLWELDFGGIEIGGGVRYRTLLGNMIPFVDAPLLVRCGGLVIRQVGGIIVSDYTTMGGAAAGHFSGFLTEICRKMLSASDQQG